MANSVRLIEALRKIGHNGRAPEILVDDGYKEYEEARQIFNRKFQFRPTAIVFCEYTEHVRDVIRVTKKFDVEIRVRSGGHDHEGECSGTDAVVIDLSKMNHVEINHAAGVARIQPGAIFKNLLKIMDRANVGVPHGTCGTVGIAGFTFGGGWGPWTRQKGMCCESLIGATIVLGDGSIRQLSIENKDDRDLLWALRGGGGMSYGIVTELVIRAFKLPTNTFKFRAQWTKSPALAVLERWENMITNDQSDRLLGTNLMIMAKPKPDTDDIEKSNHDCTFYGYYAGENDSLDGYLAEWFGDLLPEKIYIYPDEGEKHLGFSGWDRAYLEKEMPAENSLGDDNVPYYIPAEDDPPGPHKITSRLVKKEGLGDEGRKTLIRSLESELIHLQGQKAGVNCYITLGAITGPYYKNYQPDEVGSAFPYKDRPYTIQYQAWWNEGDENIRAGKQYHVERYVNDAQDWIEECRQRNFPQTKGAFISFKDNNVPIREYFLESFDRLRDIKIKYSEDPDNRFRTRKTIM